MFIGTNVIGICFEVIKPEYRNLIKERVSKYHEVMEITREQILDFCGNALEAKDKDGNLYLIMSSRAFNALNKNQLKTLNGFYKNIIQFGSSNYRKIWRWVCKMYVV